MIIHFKRRTWTPSEGLRWDSPRHPMTLRMISSDTLPVGYRYLTRLALMLDAR